MPTPTVTASSFTVKLSSERPSNDNWRVQFFDNGAAVTPVTRTPSQRVNIETGAHQFSAAWTIPDDDDHTETLPTSCTITVT